MIVDVHTHHFADTLAVRALSVLTERTRGHVWPIADGTLANHLDHLDRAGVDRAVFCPIATKPSQFDVIFREAQAIRSGERGARAAEKIVPFASVHPADPDALARVRAVAAAGIKGLKIHPYYQNFSLDDPAYVPFFRTVADCGLVVTSHAGYDVGYPGRYDACGPREIAVLLDRVPDLRFVAAHLGGCAGFEPHATDRLLERGCYIDTSALACDWHKDEQMRILRSWPADRILFGTDFPWVHYPEAIRHVRSVRAPEDWEAVFGGNAARLLGL